MATTVSRVDVLVTADVRPLRRQIRNESKKLGEDFGKGFNDSLDKELSEWGSQRLDVMRQKFMREGRESGRVFGTTLRQASERDINSWIDNIVNDISKVFTFDGDEGFKRWAGGFDSVSEASERMSKNIRIAVEEGRLQSDTADGLNSKLGDYVRRAKEVEDADLRMIAAKRDLTGHMEKLELQMSSSKAFRRHVNEVGDLDTAYRGLWGRIDQLERQGGGQKWADRMRVKLLDLSESSDRATRSVDGTNRSYRSLPHGLRQGIFWVVLITSAFEQLATIGSGAGAALTAMLASVTSAIGALGVAAGGLGVSLIWTILHATKAISLMGEEFPEAQAAMGRLAKAAEDDSRAFARAWGPALAEFSDRLAQLWRDDLMGERAGEALAKITQAFTGVLESPAYQRFQTAMETTLPAALAGIGTAAANITGGLLNIFAVAGPYIQAFAERIEAYWGAWAEGIEAAAGDGSLDRMLDGWFDSLNVILDLIESIGGFLATVFEAGRKSGDRLFGTLADVFNKWNDWLETIEGQNALEEWFRNGEAILTGFGDLLVGIGELFANIVTPETVERTLAFMDSLKGGLPFLESIIRLFGELDVFGLFAQALETIGAALTPILEILGPIADIVSTLFGFFAELSEVLYQMITPVLIPLELAWRTINLALERLIEWASPVLAALQEMGDEVAALGEDIWVELEPALSDLFDAFLELLPEPEELARIIREDVIPAIRDIADWITKRAIPTLQIWIGYIEDVITALGGWDGIKSRLQAVATAFSIFSTAVAWALSPLIALINGIVDAIKWVQSNLPNSGAGSGQGGGGGTPPRPLARGSLITRPEIVQVGEAGHEMVVPLDQPLSNVDPAVRDVAAYAQGKKGGGGGTIIEAGAIVVQGALDPRRTAIEVGQEVAEAISS